MFMNEIGAAYCHVIPIINDNLGARGPMLRCGYL
jgi:hypothetical protein